MMKKCTNALPPCTGNEFLTFIRWFLQMHYPSHLKLPAAGCSTQWGKFILFSKTDRFLQCRFVEVKISFIKEGIQQTHVQLSDLLNISLIQLLFSRGFKKKKLLPLFFPPFQLDLCFFFPSVQFLGKVDAQLVTQVQRSKLYTDITIQCWISFEVHLIPPFKTFFFFFIKVVKQIGIKQCSEEDGQEKTNKPYYLRLQGTAHFTSVSCKVQPH